MRRAIAIVVLLAPIVALSGCGGKTSIDEQIEIADVNARNALASASSANAQIEDLESRIEELEAKVEELDAAQE